MQWQMVLQVIQKLKWIRYHIASCAYGGVTIGIAQTETSDADYTGKEGYGFINHNGIPNNTKQI